MSLSLNTLCQIMCDRFFEMVGANAVHFCSHRNKTQVVVHVVIIWYYEQNILKQECSRGVPSPHWIIDAATHIPKN